MGLLDGLEKLITEHGSSGILRERIALAEDKHSKLEKENRDLLDQVETLSESNQKLESEISILKEQMRALEADTANRKLGRLPEEQEVLLNLVAHNDGVLAADLPGILAADPQVTAFHSEELHSKNLLRYPLIGGAPRRWYITQHGRRYLIEHGLLK